MHGSVSRHFRFSVLVGTSSGVPVDRRLLDVLTLDASIRSLTSLHLSSAGKKLGLGGRMENFSRSKTNLRICLDISVGHFEVRAVQSAISELKAGKAVPATSLPAEVWRLCAPEFADMLTRVLNACAVPAQPFPKQVTDCTLSLLPKPNKPGKRPADLRPLGLQDPSSKLVASVVRNQLQTHTMQYLSTRPQYAYTPGKAIDEAIARVMAHCKGLREKLQGSTRSVHDRRAKRAAMPCMGGVMLSIDLSRAFDAVPRWALLLAVQRSGAPETLQQAAGTRLCGYA